MAALCMLQSILKKLRFTWNRHFLYNAMFILFGQRFQDQLQFITFSGHKFPLLSNNMSETNVKQQQNETDIRNFFPFPNFSFFLLFPFVSFFFFSIFSCRSFSFCFLSSHFLFLSWFFFPLLLFRFVSFRFLFFIFFLLFLDGKIRKMSLCFVPCFLC